MDASWKTQTPPSSLQIRQREDDAGTLRVALLGEVDIATGEYLAAQIAQLMRARRTARLDLSDLRFIDGSGIDALVRALKAARDAGCELEVEPRVRPIVQRIIALAGLERDVWPQDAPRDGTRFEADAADRVTPRRRARG
jgi:anti-anti-sigma factor